MAKSVRRKDLWLNKPRVSDHVIIFNETTCVVFCSAIFAIIPGAKRVSHYTRIVHTLAPSNLLHGKIVTFPQVGVLLCRYERRAA
jgi:hypothetical protein